MDRADHDLDLAVALINTRWILSDPPDRLTDVRIYQDILSAAGDSTLASQLRPSDLAELRSLRSQLNDVFTSGSVEVAVRTIEPLLRAADVSIRLVARAGTAYCDPAAGQKGMTALRTRLLSAVAAHLIRNGITRLGICDATPCNCVYVDRTRSRTRRYCSDTCNDRAAAAAHRRRKRRI